MILHCERCAKELEHKDIFKVFDPLLNRDLKLCFSCRNIASKITVSIGDGKQERLISLIKNYSL